MSVTCMIHASDSSKSLCDLAVSRNQKMNVWDLLWLRKILEFFWGKVDLKLEDRKANRL